MKILDLRTVETVGEPGVEWYWTVVYDNGSRTEMRTNSHAEGIWIYGYSSVRDAQTDAFVQEWVEGTRPDSFSLKGCSKSAADKRIRRMLKKRGWE
jgi:hypothetical protein